MSCHKPVSAYRHRMTGEVKLGYDAGGSGDKLDLPCGKCLGCQMERARSWSIRISHEAQLWDSNYFVTFDYAPEHLPGSLSLEYDDFQLFMKRLRKKLPGVVDAGKYDADKAGQRPIRFFVAGEYGSFEYTMRPHWHCIFFNVRFPDLEEYKNATFRSALLERLWGKGHAVIGTVTPRSGAYVAGYTLTKVYGEAANDFYEDVANVSTGELSKRRPEFIVMSRAPGIGAWWYDRYKADLFNKDMAVQGGQKYKVPRYYWEKFRSEAPSDRVEEVEYERFLRSAAMPAELKTEHYRLVLEEVAKRRLGLFSKRR